MRTLTMEAPTLLQSETAWAEIFMPMNSTLLKARQQGSPSHESTIGSRPASASDGKAENMLTQNQRSRAVSAIAPPHPRTMCGRQRSTSQSTSQPGCCPVSSRAACRESESFAGDATGPRWSHAARGSTRFLAKLGLLSKSAAPSAGEAGTATHDRLVTATRRGELDTVCELLDEMLDGVSEEEEGEFRG